MTVQPQHKNLDKSTTPFIAAVPSKARLDWQFWGGAAPVNYDALIMNEYIVSLTYATLLLPFSYFVGVPLNASEGFTDSELPLRRIFSHIGSARTSVAESLLHY